MRTGTLAALLVLLALTAHAADEARLDNARKLFAEAEQFAAKGDSPELEEAARREGRKEARRLLRQARDDFQAWQAANPGADDEIGREIGKLLHWVNKMSSLGELSGGGGETPRPPQKKPESPPAPAPGRPTPPPPDPAQVAKDDFAALQEFEKANPADVAAVRDAYERFLAEHPDTALPEYTKAALRLGQLTEELNATFRKVAQRDPEQLANLDSSATPAVIARLKRDLTGKDAEARRNAAKVLGLTRCGAAGYALAGVLLDDDAELTKLASDSLVQIGGWRVAETLTKMYRDRGYEGQTAALDVIERIAAKGSIDARSMSFWIGRFALANDGRTAKRAIDRLVALGKDGGPGLVEAMETRVPEKKLYVMNAIGTVGYVPGASRLGMLLLRGDGGEVETYRAKAIEVIQKLGIHTIPHLLERLADPRTRQWTGYTLMQMTGERIASADVAGWRRWYDVHRNDPPKK